MGRLLQLLGSCVQFSYACWDRIVLRGYYPRLQRPENIVYLFRDIGGEACITPALLARRTASYRAWLERSAEQHGIPMLSAPKGVRKEEFVAPYYRAFRGEEGVVVVLKSMEQSATFISYEPRHAPPSGDDYRIIKRAAKRFLHYYFYILDPVMGPMSLCVGSYLPVWTPPRLQALSSLRFVVLPSAPLNSAEPIRRDNGAALRPSRVLPLKDGQPSGWPSRTSRTAGRGSHPEGRSGAEDPRERVDGRGWPCATLRSSADGPVHAVRCSRVSGLRECGCLTPRGPVWRYAGRVQIVSACSEARGR